MLDVFVHKKFLHSGSIKTKNIYIASPSGFRHSSFK